MLTVPPKVAKPNKCNSFAADSLSEDSAVGKLQCSYLYASASPHNTNVCFSVVHGRVIQVLFQLCSIPSPLSTASLKVLAVGTSPHQSCRTHDFFEIAR